MTAGRPIDGVIARFEDADRPLMRSGDGKRHFHGLYLRNTLAVRGELDRGGFVDPEWMERWDVAFAELYLDALDAWEQGRTAPTPWKVAFEAAEDPHLGALRQELIGLNAHLNFDLPQALLAVVTDADFSDVELLARRREDFRRIDDIVVARIPEEYRALRGVERPGERSRFDAALYPLNRLATRRWLKEARRKVWGNAVLLNEARRQGPDVYCSGLARLERLSCEKVAQLRAPGQVLLKLAVRGFGVTLPPPNPTLPEAVSGS